MNPLQRYHLRRLAHSLRLRPPRHLAKRTSSEAFCKHLKARGFEPATVIDVGVAHGTFEYYRTFPNAEFLLVEPMDEFRPALDWIARHYKCHVEYAAAGREDTSSVVYFHAGTDSGLHGASLVYDVKAVEEDESFLTRQVPVKRLDRMVTDLAPVV